MSGIEEIKKQLERYKKKYYKRQLLVGCLLFLIINGLTFLLFASLEHSFWLSQTGRAILLFCFISVLLISAYQLIVRFLMQFLSNKGGLSDEQAARDISAFFPEIEDKLINVLQLGTQQHNALLEAAIEKKNLQLKSFEFIQAIDFQQVKRYSIVLILFLLAIVSVSFISPSLLTESSGRIINFNREYTPDAPFSLEIINPALETFRGDDFILEVAIRGEQLPETVIVSTNENKQGKIIRPETGLLKFEFPKIQKSQSVYLESAGYQFGPFVIVVHDRPELISMDIQIQEPLYTGGRIRHVENMADLVVLQGSTIKWVLSTLAADSLRFTINQKPASPRVQSRNKYTLTERIYESGNYEIELFNAYGRNQSQLNYGIEVIKDEYPKILTDFFPDSISYSSLAMGGSISDDYGIQSLQINYKKEGSGSFSHIPIEINPNLKVQGFYANWNLDSLNLAIGQTLEVFLSVLDNDQINGFKESRSQTFRLRAPSSEEIETLISNSEKNVESSLKDSENRAKSIAERLQKIEDRLKAEQKLNWQEKKMINEVLKDREELDRQINQLQKEHEKLKNTSQQFQQQSEGLQEKNQKLQELIEQLLDEDTQELYEKLMELLKEQASPEEIAGQTEELRNREESLERDLERATELFKRLKMENALEQNLQALDSLEQKQQAASEKTGKESEELQEKVNKEFDAFRERMDEVEQMNQQLKKPEPMQDFELEEKQIAKDQREALEELRKENEERKGDNSAKEETRTEEEKQQSRSTSPAKQKQQQAAQKMKDLAKKLDKMQGGMQMEMMQANLDDLRDILDNLIKLSFNQEELMLEMREVNQSDPRFLQLSQNQLKLKDDAKVIQDSLLSLAEKVVQISSFVTREVGKVNKNIDESIAFLKDRNKNRAITSQQFAMTSMNNLALLLDETLQNMQMAMAEASGQSKERDKKPSGMPDLQELQNMLGEKINQLKESGKQGRELSEELARLAAEQELIRRQMERLKEAEDGKPGGGLGGEEMKQAIEMMQQNEMDLVNKRLTQQLIRRQQLIETRMLEAEKAQRNQEMDEEREAKSAGTISREMPPGFEEYLKMKKKEIELLKTIPLQLNPFYKKEVNDYFRRLSTEQKE